MWGGAVGGEARQTSAVGADPMAASLMNACMHAAALALALALGMFVCVWVYGQGLAVQQQHGPLIPAAWAANPSSPCCCLHAPGPARPSSGWLIDWLGLSEMSTGGGLTPLGGKCIPSCASSASGSANSSASGTQGPARRQRGGL